MCLLNNIYHRVDHPMNEYLNHFVAACNTRASAALCEVILVIPKLPHNRTDYFSRLFLPAAVRLGNLLPPAVFHGGTLSSFNSTMNLCLMRS